MSDCPICKAYSGATLQHSNSECPNKNVLCRRCHQRGHMTHMCDEKWSHWERPTCMEELIPYHIKQRYRITTSTDITFEVPRGPETVHEVHPVNEIVIPDEYKKIVKLAETYGINAKKTTKPSSDSYIQAILEWANENGYRVVHSKPPKKEKNTVVT